MISSVDTYPENHKRLVEVLGKNLIKSRIESPFDFIEIAEKGLHPKIIENFRNHFDIPMEALAGMLSTSQQTIIKWIREYPKLNKRLDPTISVKIFELAELFLYGSEVFGGKGKFFNWMNQPNRALGGMEPLKLAKYPDGISKVRDVIGRIEHGVYS